MTKPERRFTANADRLWQSLMTMATIGSTKKGGCRRIAFSELDDDARELFKTWCVDAGLRVWQDRFGNMFAERGGAADLPPLVLGSHLDTQPTGGKFDGVLGVLAALEVVRTLSDHQVKTKRRIVIVNWTNEEGAIIRPMMGSEVFTGRLSLVEALAMQDPDGRSVAELLAKMRNGAGDREVGFPIYAYLELHIEQGPILEAMRRTIGVVTGGIGFKRYSLTFTGQEAHAGTTPMTERRDAMAASACAITRITELATNLHGARATIGMITAQPGSSNTIASRVEFSLDLRHERDDVLNALEREVLDECSQVANRHNVKFTFQQINYSPASPFDTHVQEAIARNAELCGYPHTRLVSGAGHDACHIARLYPTGMIFVPSVGGISHNEAEFTSIEDCAAGVNVLLNTAVQLADETDVHTAPSQLTERSG